MQFIIIMPFKVKTMRVLCATILMISFLLFLRIISTLKDEQIHVKSRMSIRLNKHTKWIVVTTISSPTSDIAKLAAISGWKLLVVGDDKTPSNWSYPGCTFLGVEQQKMLGYSILDHLPLNSYTRKNIGYLYAIQHGAKYIYDTDDDNHPSEKNGQMKFFLEPTMSGLVYADTSKTLMNPYSHFGQPSIWPRGFPLNRVTQQNNNTYHLTNFITPVIQQGLVNSDPDVDAIYRLINRRQNRSSIRVTFDHTAPAITLPEGVFAPFNSQNTLFHYEALWAMMLPTSVTTRVTDIWRGYWAQRLLWLIGHRLAFLPPNAVQIRNPHNYISDFRNEIQLYTQVGELVDMVASWRCGSPTFSECIKQLSNDMVIAKFWDRADVKFVHAWLEDLNRVGYKLPNLITNLEHHNFATKLSTVSFPKANHSVFFNPTYECKSSAERRLDLLSFCHSNESSVLEVRDDFSTSLSSNPSYTFPNLLLVIIFNFPFYQNLKLLDTLYRDHFPNMLFCSQTDNFEEMILESTQSFPKWRTRNITFLNISSDEGFYAYECIIRVIEMNYQVDGFLMVGDDVMLNTWNLKMLKVDQGYCQHEQRFLLHRNQTHAPEQFPWWTYDNGRLATNNALDEIEELAKDTSTSIRSIAIKTFMVNRKKTNMDMKMVATALSDVYYIPRAKSDMVAEVLKIFLKHRVYTDIAVATTIGAFYGSNDDDKLFSGLSLWEEERFYVFDHFNASQHYLHPVKLMLIANVNQWRDMYCKSYLSELIKNW